MCICTSWGFADTRDEFEINADYEANQYTIGIKIVNKLINSMQKFEIIRKVKNFDDILPAIQSLRISELALENMNDAPKIYQKFTISIEDKSIQDGMADIKKEKNKVSLDKAILYEPDKTTLHDWDIERMRHEFFQRFDRANIFQR